MECSRLKLPRKTCTPKVPFRQCFSTLTLTCHSRYFPLGARSVISRPVAVGLYSHENVKGQLTFGMPVMPVTSSTLVAMLRYGLALVVVLRRLTWLILKFWRWFIILLRISFSFVCIRRPSLCHLLLRCRMWVLSLLSFFMFCLRCQRFLHLRQGSLYRW